MSEELFRTFFLLHNCISSTAFHGMMRGGCLPCSLSLGGNSLEFEVDIKPDREKSL